MLYVEEKRVFLGRYLVRHLVSW